MNMDVRIFTGEVGAAAYHTSEDPMYRHNCYVEALPPILTAARSADLMRREPAYHESERLMPPEHRLLAVQRIANYIDPMWVNLDLQQRFARVIRNGYLARNPLSPEWRKQMLAGFPNIDQGEDIPGYNARIRSAASGFTILGISGVGKSTAVESILSLYNQVIVHREYNGHPFDQHQLVWLKLDCPHDGSVRGLCTMFFQAIDQVLRTRFYEKYVTRRRTVDELLPLMTNTAATLGLGVLVIDEIQRLSSAKSGGAQQMLNFFVQLANVIGVPVVLVGTLKAYSLLTSEFAQARRSSGQGDFIWPALKFEEDSWNFFLEGLWRYQWTSTPTKLTGDLSEAIYDESQGITDIVVKLYMLAQWWVIGEKSERLSPELFRKVAKENLQMARPILQALREGNQELLCRIPDIQSPLSNLDSFYQRAVKRVATQVSVKNRLGTRPADRLQQVFNQLLLAGVGEAEAISCAKQALALCGESVGIKEVLAAAFQLATQDQVGNEPGTGSESVPRQKRPKPAVSEDDLRAIVKDARNPHEALTGAGMVKPCDEFLE